MIRTFNLFIQYLCAHVIVRPATRVIISIFSAHHAARSYTVINKERNNSSVWIIVQRRDAHIDHHMLTTKQVAISACNVTNWNIELASRKTVTSDEIMQRNWRKQKSDLGGGFAVSAQVRPITQCPTSVSIDSASSTFLDRSNRSNC